MISDPKEIAKDIFQAALRAVDPYHAVSRHIEHIKKRFREGSYKRIIAVGMGKASGEMARALHDGIGNLIDIGIVVTKHGAASLSKGRTGSITVREGGHPIPDEAGVNAAMEIAKLLESTDEQTIVVCLISGGGSALMAAPYGDITLTEKQAVTQGLLRAGADITEINAVRKHISAVKGGRLARLASPATIISLIISDVIGDPLDVIASGPTAPDASTYKQAAEILEKYQIELPDHVTAHIRRGLNGETPETPDTRDDVFQRVENIIIAGNRDALNAAKARASELDLKPEVLTDRLQGDVADASQWLFSQMEKHTDSDRNCLIAGGETTVVVKGEGLGGRNMEFALRFGLLIEGKPHCCMLSAGTDGTDGPTDAAGAIVDGNSMVKARAMGLNPEEFLKNNDSYHFFKQSGELLITGPTGTNVMDIQLVLLNREAEVDI